MRHGENRSLLRMQGWDQEDFVSFPALSKTSCVTLENSFPCISSVTPLVVEIQELPGLWKGKKKHLSPLLGYGEEQ